MDVENEFNKLLDDIVKNCNTSMQRFDHITACLEIQGVVNQSMKSTFMAVDERLKFLEKKLEELEKRLGESILNFNNLQARVEKYETEFRKSIVEIFAHIEKNDILRSMIGKRLETIEMKLEEYEKNEI